MADRSINPDRDILSLQKLFGLVILNRLYRTWRLIVC